MRMNTSIFGMEKYSFRAKIQKISQLKFRLYSKTVTSALLLYSSMTTTHQSRCDHFVVQPIPNPFAPSNHILGISNISEISSRDFQLIRYFKNITDFKNIRYFVLCQSVCVCVSSHRLTFICVCVLSHRLTFVCVCRHTSGGANRGEGLCERSEQICERSEQICR